MMRSVTIGDSTVKQVTFANDQPISIISGTCAIESRDRAMKTAETMVSLCEELGIGLIYKGSFDKANRTSVSGKRGVGLDEGLKILQEVRETFGVPVLTDVHERAQVDAVAQVVDVLQIPAFLARQTDLLVACADAVKTQEGKAVNIKKGQFMAPQDMHSAAQKVADSGSEQVLLTERGTTFGYGNLVVDMRSFPIMGQDFDGKGGYPTIHDATHSVMMPSVHGNASGGRRDYVEPLARAAVAAGISGLFVETHPEPSDAISDKETQIPLEYMPTLLKGLKAIDDVVKNTARADIPAAS